jgi:hypothetical protein
MISEYYVGELSMFEVIMQYCDEEEEASHFNEYEEALEFYNRCVEFGGYTSLGLFYVDMTQPISIH